MPAPGVFAGSAGEVEGRDMKLTKAHIAEEWADSDGYWIALKSGFKWSGDPVGNDHLIHEDTKALAWREGVLPCACADCRPKNLTVVNKQTSGEI